MSTTLFVVLVLLAFFGGSTIGYWTCRYEFKESAPSASTNSRYVAALQTIDEFTKDWSDSHSVGGFFKQWVQERLNAGKDPHCT